MNTKGNRSTGKTRRALKQALVHLLCEKPINEITVREISELADLNRGTFYLHYRDVFDMVEQIENEMIAEILHMLDAYTPEAEVGSPYALLKDIFGYVAQNADMCRVLLSRNGDIALLEKLKTVVSGHILHYWDALLDKRGSKYYALYNAYIISGCIGLVESWLNSGMKESPEEIAGIAQDMMVKGVLALE